MITRTLLHSQKHLGINLRFDGASMFGAVFPSLKGCVQAILQCVRIICWRVLVFYGTPALFRVMTSLFYGILLVSLCVQAGCFAVRLPCVLLCSWYGGFVSRCVKAVSWSVLFVSRLFYVVSSLFPGVTKLSFKRVPPLLRTISLVLNRRFGFQR